MFLQSTSSRLSADWVQRSSGCSLVNYHRPTGKITRGALTEGTVYSAATFWEKAPLRAYFDYTNLCNLHCAHCITSSGPDARTDLELSTPRVLEIIQELAALGVFEIQVSGGEPLVHHDWREILACITMSGTNLILTTNGTRLTDRTVADLLAIKPLEVRVSFDGAESLHDSIRGRGAYAKAIAGVSRLVASGIPTAARFTLVQNGELELPKLCDDLAKVGVQRLKVAVIKEAGRAAEGHGRELLRALPTLDLANGLKRLGGNTGIDIQLSMDDFPVDVEVSHDPKLRDAERPNCGAGFETCYIAPRGDVLGCVTIPGMGFGNVRDRSFRDVWESRVAGEYRHQATASGARRLCDALNAPTLATSRLTLALV